MPKLFMFRRCSAPFPDTKGVGQRTSFSIRALHERDLDPLGGVLFRAYEGGPEQTENSVEEGADEIRRCASGDYGAMRYDGVSTVATDADGVVVGASIVTMFEGIPLLAHAIVEPRARGFGVGGTLIRATVAAMARCGDELLTLAVAATNPDAALLYLRLGFRLASSIEEAGPFHFGDWTNDTHLLGARAILAKALGDHEEPQHYGVLLTRGVSLVHSHVNHDGVHRLPWFCLAAVSGHRKGDATIELTPVQLDAAIALLEPAEAHKGWDHPNLWSWRAIRTAWQPGDRITAVFGADAASATSVRGSP